MVSQLYEMNEEVTGGPGWPVLPALFLILSASISFLRRNVPKSPLHLRSRKPACVMASEGVLVSDDFHTLGNCFSPSFWQEL